MAAEIPLFGNFVSQARQNCQYIQQKPGGIGFEQIQM